LFFPTPSPNLYPAFLRSSNPIPKVFSSLFSSFYSFVVCYFFISCYVLGYLVNFFDPKDYGNPKVFKFLVVLTPAKSKILFLISYSAVKLIISSSYYSSSCSTISSSSILVSF